MDLSDQLTTAERVFLHLPQQLTPAQQGLLGLLQDALHRSNLMSELGRFLKKSDFEDWEENGGGHCDAIQQADKTIAMLRVKQASQEFINLVPRLTQKQYSTLRELELHDLLSQRTWLNLILASSKAEPRIRFVDTVHRKLVFISTHHLTPDAMNEVDDVNDTEVPQQHVDHARKGAISGYIAGLLTVSIAALFCAAIAPQLVDWINNWFVSNSVSYKTVSALMVIALGIACFHLISHGLYPSAAGRAGGKSAHNAAEETGGIFNFRASTRRVVAGCAGPMLHGIGAGITTSSGLGSMGAIVMIDGIHQTYQLPLFASQWIVASSSFLIAWWWARIPLGVGTLPVIFVLGPALSLGSTLAPENMDFFGDLIACLVGTLVFAAGVAITAAAALGPDGQTALALAAEKKNNWPIPHSNLFFALTTIGVGVVLGGNFGLATLLNLMIVPVLLYFLIPPFRRYLAE